MASSTAIQASPEGFTRAAESLRSVRLRPEVHRYEEPAPTRIAPFASAVGLELLRDDDEVATARLVLLHDPAGQPAWAGTSRLVGFVRASVDAEMAGDSLLPEVAWSWLTESLDQRGAARHAAGGTVTCTRSTRFGALAGEPEAHEVELRCSWTPDAGADGEDDLGAHLMALVDLVAHLSGLPPEVAGVTTLPRRPSAD